MSLISKLKKKQRPTPEVGLLVDDIIMLDSNFDFCAYVFVRREGNKVAHILALCLELLSLA